MNNCTFAGNVGRDSVARTVQGDKHVLNFSLAVEQGYGDKKSTMWVNCALWGERGKKLEQYIVKGTRIVVCGEVGLRQYEDKDGKPRADVTLNVRDVKLMSSQDRQEKAAEGAKVASKPSEDDPYFSDEVPF